MLFKIIPTRIESTNYTDETFLKTGSPTVITRHS